MPKNILRAEEIAATPEYELHHPLNPATKNFLRMLGQPSGLERIGVMIVRVAPNAESFPYHFHHGEEEFAYVLSGRGVCEIGTEISEIGPGDFIGFPAGPTG